MSDVSAVRVFLLDDHEMVRAGVRAVLAAEPDVAVVGEWDKASDAPRRILAASPDVAVLDVRLPDGSGVEVLREVREQDPDIKGLILTGYRDDVAMLAAVLAGASGFVLKRIAVDSLVDAVRLVASGHSMIDPAVVIRMTARDRAVTDSVPGLAELTPTERRVLALVGQGLSNRQIGETLAVAEKTVKNHVTRILAKLGVSRRTQAALLATRNDLA